MKQLIIMKLEQQAYMAWVNGKSKVQVAAEYGISPRTLGRWFDKLTESKDPICTSAKTEEANCVAHVNKNFKRLPDKALNPKQPKLTPKQVDENLEGFLEFIESLAPNKFEVSTQTISTPTISRDNKVAVCAGDFHFGHECYNSINIFYEVIRELQPDQIILNGDTLDMFALSTYPKDIRSSYNLQQERTAYHDLLFNIAQISPNSRIVETNANHSGDSIDGRWWRYLSTRLGELASIPEVREKLSYENLFLPKGFDMELVDTVTLGADFNIVHGDVVRAKAGASAMGLIDKWNASVMCNHTHRMGSTSRRVPSIGGRPEARHIAYENGCMCDMSPVYASAPDWQNGFSIIHYNDVDVAVEQVHINGNRALSTTLGKEIKV
jgi:hypothetical protein